MAIATSCWQTAPESPAVSTGQIDLWRFRLDLSQTHVTELKEYLNTAETVRAERLLIANKRQQFIVARAFLRQILSSYLSCDPATLCFDYAEHGKPSLVNAANLHFNLAHSGNWGVLAVCADVIGVDVEEVDSNLNCLLLAQRYFSVEEQAVLIASAAERHRRTFYRLWTVKESWLKLQGCGLSAVAQVAGQTENNRHFHLGKNYVAAISFSRPVSIINKYDFT